MKDSQRRAMFAKYKVAQNVMRGYDTNWQYFKNKKDAVEYTKRGAYPTVIKHIYKVTDKKIPLYVHDSGRVSAKKPSYEYSDSEKEYL